MTAARLTEIVVDPIDLPSERIRAAGQGLASSSDGLAATAGKLVRTIAAGEILYDEGNPRTLYRVESGAICHYVHNGLDGRPEVLEHVFAGDLVGLGYISTHISSARAMVETRVSAVSDAEFDCELATNSVLEMRMAAAAEREFEALRKRALAERSSNVEARLACYLLALSSINASEGRAPDHIPEEVTSGYVSGLLDISLDALEMGLKRLAAKGLVSACAGALRLNDLAALERHAASRA